MQAQTNKIPLQQQPIVIIDLGSFSIKAGQFSINQLSQYSQMQPQINMPNVLGSIRRTCPTQILCLITPREDFIGDQAFSKMGVLDLKYPVYCGKIMDYVSIQQVLRHVYFNQLRVDPQQQHPVLIIRSHNPSQQQQNDNKLLQMLFKVLKVPKLCLIDQFTITLMYFYHQQFLNNIKNGDKQKKSKKSNITNNNNQNIHILTGVVVSSGHTHTVIVPIIQGKIVHHAVIELQLGGKHVQQYFIALFKNKYDLSCKYERIIARNIKQQLFYVALDAQKYQQQFKQSYNNTKHKIYTLQSSYTNQIKQQIFQSCQVLFNPGLLKNIQSQQQQFKNVPQCGIAEAIVNSIMNVQQKYYQILFNNIVLSGGNIMFQGITQRVQKQIYRMLQKYEDKPKINVKLHKLSQPKYAAYIGACHYLRYYTDQVSWINKQQYVTKKSTN